MRWLLADWGKSKRERFDAVVKGLRGLGHEVVRIPRNDMKRRPDLLEAIECGGFDALITWQRFFRMQRDIRGALTRSGIRTVYMDFGFVPHYQSVVFDTEGENATSSWPAMWRSGGVPTPEPEFMAAAERLVEDAAARVARLDCPLGDDSEVPRRPFIFVPLQRTGDSVVKYDSSVNDFGALVRWVLALADDHWFVVIKTHPLDRELDLGVADHEPGRHVVLRNAFGEANEAACDWLLANASAVVGINSNMLFRAMCFGTPVIATGRGWHSGSGVVHEVDGVAGLESLSVPDLDRSAQVRYIGFALSRQLQFSELTDPGKLGPLLARLEPQERKGRAVHRKKEAGMSKVPRVFHQVWLGGDVPEGLLRVQQRMLELHPGWEHVLWTEDTLPPLINAEQFDEAPEPQFKADVARYELLARFGGVYVD
ncbi:MAG TPA: hypothetical protein PLU35_09570 [Phycisphaerales bacterium]|nr:hypothetical protein [Phycisphaerales bacterium]